MAVLVLKERGEDVRQSQWFIDYTSKLVEEYVKFKQTSKDGEFLRAEISFNHRAKRIIKPSWVFWMKRNSEDIKLEVVE